MYVEILTCSQDPIVPHGMFPGLVRRIEGTQVGLVCEENYKINGSSDIFTCSGEKWIGSAQCSTNLYFVFRVFQN